MMKVKDKKEEAWKVSVERKDVWTIRGKYS